MKWFSWTMTIMLGLSMFLTACGATGVEATSEPSPSTVRVAMGVNMPPFESIDPYKGELEGFDVDLINAIAVETGLEIEIIESDYNLLLNLIGACEFDAAISSIPISERYSQGMDFSDPYYTARHSLVVKKGNVVITGLDTLTDMRISTQVNSPSELELMKLTGIQAETNGTFEAAFQELASGYIDGVIADTPRAERFVDFKPYNLKIVGAEFGEPMHYGIAVCKRRPDVLETINEGLKRVTENGTLDRLTRKWITNNFQ